MRCDVCYNNFTTENPPFILNCGHSYHRECISKLENISGYSKCPDCRTPIVNIAKNYLATKMINNDEETITEELIDKYEEAAVLFSKRMRESMSLKKEIIELNSKRDDIIQSYKVQCSNILNQGHVKAINIIYDSINRYSDPFKTQIKGLIDMKKDLIKNKFVSEQFSDLEIQRESMC